MAIAPGCVSAASIESNQANGIGPGVNAWVEFRNPRTQALPAGGAGAARRRAPVAPGRNKPSRTEGLSRPVPRGAALQRKVGGEFEHLPSPCASGPSRGEDPRTTALDGRRREDL